jgi:hypothetical protein
MLLTIQSLSDLRPYAYHICSLINFESIRSSKSLMSASELLTGTPHEHLLVGRRTKTHRVEVAGKAVEVRDHRPLALGSLALPDGYTVNEFIGELNSRVFFWAGKASWLVPSGRNHIGRYSEEGEVVILRIPLLSLVASNEKNLPEITTCNSGAARHHQGKPAQRSVATFVKLPSVHHKPSDVVEITFSRKVELPAETQYSLNSGEWQKLKT